MEISNVLFQHKGVLFSTQHFVSHRSALKQLTTCDGYMSLSMLLCVAGAEAHGDTLKRVPLHE
jgi:hypothetical protein